MSAEGQRQGPGWETAGALGSPLLNPAVALRLGFLSVKCKQALPAARWVQVPNTVGLIPVSLRGRTNQGLSPTSSSLLKSVNT